jgi:ABC-type transport system substrate-binding protein
LPPPLELPLPTPLGHLGRPALAQIAARTLRFVPAVALTSVDPLWSLATISYTHGYMIWDTLFSLDHNFAPCPQAAERAEVSSDELTWTITLRDGLIFHDNVPVLARDAVASVKRWSQKDPIGQTIAAITNDIKTIDDKRFQIILKQPFRTMLFSLASRNTFVQPERIASTPVGEQFKEVIGSGHTDFSTTSSRPVRSHTTHAGTNTSHAVNRRISGRAGMSPTSTVSNGPRNRTPRQPQRRCSGARLTGFSSRCSI